MENTNGWIAISFNSELISSFQTEPVLQEDLYQPVQWVEK